MKEKELKNDDFFTKSRRLELIDPNASFPYLSVSSETVWIKSNVKTNADGSHRILLWERNPAHPGGEVFIGDAAPHEAACSVRICELVAERVLVICSDEEASDYKLRKMSEQTQAQRLQTERDAARNEFLRKYQAAFGFLVGGREAWTAIQKAENPPDDDLARDALHSIGVENINREKRAA